MWGESLRGPEMELEPSLCTMEAQSQPEDVHMICETVSGHGCYLGDTGFLCDLCMGPGLSSCLLFAHQSSLTEPRCFPFLLVLSQRTVKAGVTLW